MPKNNYQTFWVCDTCNAPFSLFSPVKRKQVYCPYCGDHDHVHTYEGVRSYTSDKRKPIWTDEELAVMEKVLAGKLSPIQAALMIGRSPNAVTKKKMRMAREREARGKKAK